MSADYLNGCASFLACLKPYMRLTETSKGIECFMTLADGQEIKVVGKDQPRIALNLMSALVNMIPEPGSDEKVNALPVSHSMPAFKQQVSETIMHSTMKAKPMDDATRTARETIGVTTKVSLRAMVKAVADERGVPVSVVARDLLQDGLSRFDRESRTKNTSKLLADYERKANDFFGAVTEHWVIRGERRLIMKARLTAGEYERSTSSFVNCVLAEALNHCETAAALRAAEVASVITPAITEEAIEHAIAAVNGVRGPKAKTVALEVGLGEQRALANLILSGSVCAPARVLSKMAAYLKVPLGALSVALERCFAAQPLPAFKATEGKPEVQLQRTPWAVAVKELKLPADEEARLLQLEG